MPQPYRSYLYPLDLPRKPVVLLRTLNQPFLVRGDSLDDFALASVHDDIAVSLVEGVETVVLHRRDVDDVGFGELSELFDVPFQQRDSVLKFRTSSSAPETLISVPRATIFNFGKICVSMVMLLFWNPE